MQKPSFTNIEMWLDRGDTFWSSTDKKEFGINEELGKKMNKHAFFDNANEYIKEVNKPMKIRLRIEDLKEELEMKHNALPWED